LDLPFVLKIDHIQHAPIPASQATSQAINRTKLCRAFSEECAGKNVWNLWICVWKLCGLSVDIFLW